MNKVVLSKVIDIISGGTPKTKVPEYWNGSVGWLSVTDFNNDLRNVYRTEKTITELGVKHSNTKFLEKGDIIISARGTVGALAQIGTRMCFNQSCFGIRGKEGVLDTDFLYYSLKNYVRHIVKRSQGSVFDTINLASFNLMEIEIPNQVTSQKRIAKVLSDLDTKIELNNKINTELEAMAKLIYDYWFVQFDFPDENGRPYKSSGGKMVYNEELKREIPEGWEVKELGEITKRSNQTIDPSKNPNETFKLYSIPGFDECGSFQEVHGNEIKSSKFQIDQRDLLVSKLNPRFNRVIYAEDLSAQISSTEFVVWRTADDFIKAFLYILARSTHFQSFCIQNATGSSGSHRRINPEVMMAYRVPINDDILVEYGEKVHDQIRLFHNNMKQNQKLAELRDWLLPMLMNGQVRVGEAAKETEM